MAKGYRNRVAVTNRLFCPPLLVAPILAISDVLTTQTIVLLISFLAPTVDQQVVLLPIFVSLSLREALCIASAWLKSKVDPMGSE